MTDCSEFGCTKPAHAKGLCDTHYRQLKNTGETRKIKKIDGNQGCKIGNCPNKHFQNGYCNGHQRQYERNGRIVSSVIKKYDSAQGCKVKGCPNPHKGLGYCGGHKKQINKFGRIVKKELRVYRRK